MRAPRGGDSLNINFGMYVHWVAARLYLGGILPCSPPIFAIARLELDQPSLSAPSLHQCVLYVGFQTPR